MCCTRTEIFQCLIICGPTKISEACITQTAVTAWLYTARQSFRRPLWDLNTINLALIQWDFFLNAKSRFQDWNIMQLFWNSVLKQLIYSALQYISKNRWGKQLLTFIYQQEFKWFLICSPHYNWHLRGKQHVSRISTWNTCKKKKYKDELLRERKMSGRTDRKNFG